MTSKNIFTILRIGLAFVFLANGLTAFLMPEEFIELLSGSFVSNLLPVSVATFVLFIGFNDTIMSLLILSNKYRKYVFGWACVWLVGVMIVVGEPFDIMEHIGFLTMALALWLNAKYHTRS